MQNLKLQSMCSQSIVIKQKKIYTYKIERIESEKKEHRYRLKCALLCSITLRHNVNTLSLIHYTNLSFDSVCIRMPYTAHILQIEFSYIFIIVLNFDSTFFTIAKWKFWMCSKFYHDSSLLKIGCASSVLDGNIWASVW